MTDKDATAAATMDSTTNDATFGPIIDAFDVLGARDVGRGQRVPDADEDNVTLTADLIVAAQRAGHAIETVHVAGSFHEGAATILAHVANVAPDRVVLHARDITPDALAGQADLGPGTLVAFVESGRKGDGDSCRGVAFVIGAAGTAEAFVADAATTSSVTALAKACAAALPGLRARGFAAPDRPGIATDAEEAQRCLTIYDDGVGAIAQGAFVSEQAYEEKAAARYGMEGQKRADGSLLFPPRESDPDTGATLDETVRLAGTGTVFAITRIGKGGAPTEFLPYQAAVGSYDVAIVELDEGPRVAAMLTSDSRTRLGLEDEDPIPIGTPLESVVRLLFMQQGHRRYNFKFRPQAPA